MHDGISGHDKASVGRTYGKFPIPLLKAGVDKFEFDVAIPEWQTGASHG